MAEGSEGWCGLVWVPWLGETWADGRTSTSMAASGKLLARRALSWRARRGATAPHVNGENPLQVAASLRRPFQSGRPGAGTRALWGLRLGSPVGLDLLYASRALTVAGGHAHSHDDRKLNDISQH